MNNWRVVQARVGQFFKVNFYLLKVSFWSISRIFGYWYKNKNLPMVIVHGINNQEDNDWWEKQYISLSKKRKKMNETP